MPYADTDSVSGRARWREYQPGNGAEGAAAGLLITPDPSSPDRYFYLPLEPRLSSRSDGKPVFSLTVVLTRPPKPGEASILPLIDRSLFTASFTLALRPEQRAAIADGYVPLFARKAAFCLAAPNVEPVASADAAGPEPEAALSATLNRDATLTIVSAIEGASSPLNVEVHLEYVAGTAEQTTALQGRWAAVYDALAAVADANGSLSLDTLKTAFGTLVSGGTVTTSPSGVDPDPLFPAFLRATPFILERKTPALGVYDPRNLHTLRKRPNAIMPLNATDTVSGPVIENVTIAAPLDTVLAPLRDFSDLGEFVRLVAADPNGGNNYIEVPRLSSAQRSAPGTRGGPESASMKLALSNGFAKSLALTMVADRSAVPDARALMASDAVGRAGHDWVANDYVLHNVIDPQAADVSLPILGNGGPLWSDRVRPSLRWYAPAFAITMPAPNAASDASPFLFRFTQSGVIGGANPRPGLNGSVRFTLQKTMPDAVQTALALHEFEARAVPTESLAVSLELPFRDASSGATITQLLPAKIDGSGDTLTATVDLLDDWVRLCYGALAYPNFQSQPPRIVVTYAYRGYLAITGNDRPPFVWGGKIAQYIVAPRPEDVPANVAKPVYSLAENKLYLSAGELHFSREAPAASSVAARNVMVAAASSHIAAAVVAAPIAHPALEYSPAMVGLFHTTRYVTTSGVSEQRTDAVFACSTYGNFYVQSGPNGDMPIGCQDALRLGQIPYKQFDEIGELATPQYKVYRSLQQPGRYMVVPAGYRITRYAATEGSDKAFRPVILLYGVLDPDPSKNRYYFRSTLQPDLPYASWRQLQEKLVPYAPSGQTPFIEFPTDPSVQASTNYAWNIPAGISQPEAEQMWDGFQVSISANLTDSLLLKTLIDTTGITGLATFQLPDGLAISSQLSLDTLIAGPWAGGPVSVALGSGVATLTNNIEQPVNVTDMFTVSGSAPGQRKPVNVQIASHASAQVPLTSPASDAYVAYAPVAARLSLAELDIFSEDVLTHLIFANQISYANHALARLDGKVKLKNVDHVYPVALTEGQSSSVDITLPLSTYLENQVAQFQITKTPTTGPAVSTEWIDWDLQAKGNIVSLTWDLIQ
jgi:hypothetical protein